MKSAEDILNIFTCIDHIVPDCNCTEFWGEDNIWYGDICIVCKKPVQDEYWKQPFSMECPTGKHKRRSSG